MTPPQPHPSPPPRPREVSLVRKLVSPSGLVLVLFCLFLPFVGVSCETGLGTLRIQATGWDLAVNGEPSVSGSAISSGDLRDLPGASEWSDDQRVGAHPLMLIGVLAVLTGLVLGTILQTVRARALAGLAAAGVGAVLFAVNEVVVLVGMRDRIEEQIGWAGDELSGTTGYGFWVTLLLLAGIAGYNLTELLLARGSSGAPPPGYGPPPGPNPPPWPAGPGQGHPSMPPPPAPPYQGPAPGAYGYPGGYPYDPYYPYGPPGANQPGPG